MSNTSLVLEALRAAIEDPHKLKKIDYSLEEISHELQSCRSPSDDDDDPSLSLRSGRNKKVGKFSVITKEMVELAYMPTSEFNTPMPKETAFTRSLKGVGFSVIKTLRLFVRCQSWMLPHSQCIEQTLSPIGDGDA